MVGSPAWLGFRSLGLNKKGCNRTLTIFYENENFDKVNMKRINFLDLNYNKVRICILKKVLKH